MDKFTDTSLRGTGGGRVDFKYYNSAFANIQLLRVVPGNGEGGERVAGETRC
jgi:hypothetical protein